MKLRIRIPWGIERRRYDRWVRWKTIQISVDVASEYEITWPTVIGICTCGSALMQNEDGSEFCEGRFEECGQAIGP